MGFCRPRQSTTCWPSLTPSMSTAPEPTMTSHHFDGVLFVGFGGPTPGCCERFSPCPGSEAVCFVRAIIGERPGVQARLAEVAAHYTHLGGFSPFNALTLQQAHSVAARLQAQGVSVPVRVGMRYWPPYVRDVLREMAAQGRRQLLAVILSPFQCTASWEAYQQVVAEGVRALGSQGPRVTYLVPWYTHPGFIEAIAATVQQASQVLGPARAQRAALIYTAHAIPQTMATGAPYTQQFATTAPAAAQRLGQWWQIAGYRAPPWPTAGASGLPSGVPESSHWHAVPVAPARH